MASDEAVAVMHRLFDEVYGQGHADLVDELVAIPFFAGYLKGFVAVLHATLSGISCRVEETVAEGEQVSARLCLAGAHTGEFRHPLGSAAATGNRVALSGICNCRVREGKVTAFSQEWNMPGLLLQLGVLTMPAVTD